MPEILQRVWSILLLVLSWVWKAFLWLLPFLIVLFVFWLLWNLALWLWGSQRRRMSRAFKLVNKERLIIGRVGTVYEVQTQLRGAPIPCKMTGPVPPLDVVLVIDRSGSMGWARKLWIAKRAAFRFIRTMKFPRHRVGVVFFDTDADVIAGLSTSRWRLGWKLFRVGVGGGTAIDEGLRAATRLLDEEKREDVEGVIVLLSDGQSDPAAARRAAEEAKQRGYRLVTVAFGDDADRDLLKELASQPLDFYDAHEIRWLPAIYHGIAYAVTRRLPVTDLRIRHLVDTRYYNLVLEPEPEQLAKADRHSVEWHLPQLPLGKQVLRFYVEAKRPGWHPVLRRTEVRYRECEEREVEDTLPEGLYILTLPSLRQWILGLLARLFWWARDYLAERCYCPLWIVGFGLWSLVWGGLIWKGVVSNPLTMGVGGLVAVGLLLMALRCWRACVEEVVEPEFQPARARPEPLPPLDFEPPWQVQPALIIGIGNAGQWVLTHLKKSLKSSGGGTLPPGIRFLAINAKGEARNIEFAGESLAEEETFLLTQDLQPLVRQMVAGQQPPLIEEWFPAKGYLSIGIQTDLGHGTYGRRPLARAGLLDALHRGWDDEDGLWKRLLKACEEVQDEDGQIRIIIAGSLAEGMSGTLVDIAYLARSAGYRLTGGGKVSVEAFLTTASAHGPSAGEQVNTFATLREISRYQSADIPAAAKTIPYRGLDAGNPARGQEEVRILFDDLFLFGGDGRPIRDGRRSSAPWATVLASMADVIGFRLDRVAEESWRSRRHELAAQARKIGSRHSTLVVGTAGSYVVRFPLPEMLEFLKMQWVGTFLKAAMQGSETEGWLPREMARKYVRGDLPCGRPPVGWWVVNRVLDDEYVYWRYLREVLEQEDTFADYWRHTLDLLLNGGSGSPSRQMGAGHQGIWTLAFAREVDQLLAEAMSKFPQGRFPEEDEAWETLHQRVSEWRGLIRRSIAALEAQERLLLGDDADSNSGLVRELQMGLGQWQRWQRQMNQVGVREYIWTTGEETDAESLVKQWFEEYGRPALEDFLERFYWEVQDDGNVTLTLIVDEQRGIPLREDTLDRVQSSLFRLADYAFEPLWRLSLSDIMLQRWKFTNEHQIRGFLQRAWDVATPHSAFKSQRQERTGSVMAGMNHSLQNDLPFEVKDAFETPIRWLGSVVASVQNHEIIPYSDRYSFVFLHTEDLLLLHELEEYTALTRSYQQSVMNRDQTNQDAFHVFVPEHRAVGMEAGFPRRLYVAWRPLIPQIVATFANRRRLEYFALAWAAGWIQRRGDAVSVVIDGYDVYTFPPDSVQDEVAALLAFVFPRPTEVERMDALERHLAQVLDSPAPHIVERWERFLTRWHRGEPEDLKTSPRRYRDLALVAAMIAEHWTGSFLKK